MNTKKATEAAELWQGDLDDLAGTYTIDDGHAGSYDHEATVSVGDGAAVTVTCSCGQWEQTGEARFGDDGGPAVLAAWKAHVYKATGRGPVEGLPTDHQADTSRRGEIVRAKHPSGRVDDFEIVSTWTSSYTGIPMMTLMRPGGFSFDVPADEVKQMQPAPKQPKECKRRGCTANTMPGSVYCTDLHQRWDNPRAVLIGVSR